MKNKELLNICYKFFNRFITADVLIEQLSNIDKTNLLKNDIDETNMMIKNIEKIANDIPNKVDKYVVKKKKNINKLIKKIEQISKDNNNIEIFNNQLNNLQKDYAREMD